MSRPSSVVIRMEDDYNDLGLPRKRDASPFPRPYTELVWPLPTWPHRVTVHLPATMTPVEYDSMMAFLALSRSGLVPETN